jgi:hypothetical protein
VTVEMRFESFLRPPMIVQVLLALRGWQEVQNQVWLAGAKDRLEHNVEGHRRTEFP